MDQSGNELKSLLLELSYEKREVTLSSGRKSNFYFDGKQTALHPVGAYLLGQAFFEKIKNHAPEAKAVGGPTLGADPLITSVSLAAHTKGVFWPAFIIRKEPKKHGTEAYIEGTKNLEAGMPVVILEDVVTSGASSILAAKRATDFGLKVLGIFAIVDREEGGEEALEELGLKLVSLFKKSDLISPNTL